MVRVPQVPLLLLTSLTVVCSIGPKVLNIKAGEMVVMHCPWNHHPELVWTSHTSQGMTHTNITSASADHRQTDVLILGWSLVIVRASDVHQGNYSCSVRNTSNQFWFRLRVDTSKSRDHEERSQYPTTCFTQDSCTLFCPTESIPNRDTPNITSRGITWYKEGQTSPTHHYFSSVQDKDSGVYTCIRSYLYRGHIYNRSFTVALDVQPSRKYRQSVILSPQHNDVFPVDLGSTAVIECKAVMYSDYEEVFWISDKSFVEINDSLPVFYNYSRTKSTNVIHMTASLVFKRVSEEEMFKNYTCKLESDLQLSTFATITLSIRAHPISHFSSLRLVLCILIVLIMIIVFIIVIQKSKLINALCHRGPFGWKDSSPSSGEPGSGSHLLHSSAAKPNQTC
ncbi:interleukin-1 receptor type 1-like [Nothobranchius furzeri]|uniref:Interleukin-1 receptor type 1-like n=1 Tax=Nothobranchius furzeri TaxID=105023 RepID=A0A8C6KPM4_NOTFU|nr:interleukin-1 receptor type 1-like [Nothobranchius furzeri]